MCVFLNLNRFTFKNFMFLETPFKSLYLETIYGLKGPGWILCGNVSLFFQRWSLNTPNKKMIQSKVKIVVHYFVYKSHYLVTK